MELSQNHKMLRAYSAYIGAFCFGEMDCDNPDYDSAEGFQCFPNLTTNYDLSGNLMSDPQFQTLER